MKWRAAAAAVAAGGCGGCGEYVRPGGRRARHWRGARLAPPPALARDVTWPGPDYTRRLFLSTPNYLDPSFVQQSTYLSLKRKYHIK